MPLSIRDIPAIALLAAVGAIGAAAQPASPPASATASGAPSKDLNSLLGSVKTTGDDFLLPDKAFRFDALAAGSDQVVLNWEIAEGYYLYRARIKVTTPSASAQLGAPQFPAGQFKTDEYFGRQEIYTRELRVTVPVARAAGGAFSLPLQVSYQGCAEKGLCYPPITKRMSVTLPAGGASTGTAAAGSPGFPGAGAGAGGGPRGLGEQDWVASLIRTGRPLPLLRWF